MKAAGLRFGHATHLFLVGYVIANLHVFPLCVCRYGMTPLMMAAKTGRLAVCRLLLQREAAVDIGDTRGNTVCSAACCCHGSSWLMACLIFVCARVCVCACVRASALLSLLHTPRH